MKRKKAGPQAGDAAAGAKGQTEDGLNTPQVDCQGKGDPSPAGPLPGPATAPKRKRKPAPPAPEEVALGSGSASDAMGPADGQAPVARSVHMDAKPAGKLTCSKRFPRLKGLAYGGNDNDLVVARDDIPEAEREPLWQWLASRPELGAASSSLIWEHIYGLWRDEMAGNLVYVPEFGCWWTREAFEKSANSHAVREVIGTAATKIGQLQLESVDLPSYKGKRPSLKRAILRTRRELGMCGPVATIITTKHSISWDHPGSGTQLLRLWEFFVTHFGEEHAMPSLGGACGSNPVHTPINELARNYRLVITNLVEHLEHGDKHSEYTCHGLAIHLPAQVPGATCSENGFNAATPATPKP